MIDVNLIAMIYLVIGLALTAMSWHKRGEDNIVKMMNDPYYEDMWPFTMVVLTATALTLLVFMWPAFVFYRVFVREEK